MKLPSAAIIYLVDYCNHVMVGVANIKLIVELKAEVEDNDAEDADIPVVQIEPVVLVLESLINRTHSKSKNKTLFFITDRGGGGDATCCINSLLIESSSLNTVK